MLSERETLLRDLFNSIAKAGGFVTSPMPLKQGMPMRFEAQPERGREIADHLAQRGFKVSNAGEGTRMLPKGRDVAPQMVLVYELAIPGEKPAPETELSNAADRAKRRQRLAQSKRQLLGAA
jgi:hypothetical protein